MIGQLINEFDSSNNTTLADFNDLFKTELEGDSSAQVEIGRMVLGGMRELIIDGKIELIELRDIAKRIEVGRHGKKKVFNDDKERVLFSDMRELVNILTPIKIVYTNKEYYNEY